MPESVNLLPPNRTATETRLSQAMAAISDLPVDIRSVRSPASCPVALLPWLAWDFSVDDWDSSWPEAKKRAVIASSVDVHRHKGTVGALKSAVNALGYDAIDVREWFQLTPQGDPYTFGVRVVVDQTGIPESVDFDQIENVVNSAKNVRSWLTGVDILGKTTATIAVGAVALCGETVTINAGE
jgi:phage tail P2-like protein